MGVGHGMFHAGLGPKELSPPTRNQTLTSLEAVWAKVSLVTDVVGDGSRYVEDAWDLWSLVGRVGVQNVPSRSSGHRCSAG